MSAPVRGGPGKDPRIVTFCSALESLLESLDATVRIARWRGGEGDPIPEPLERSAAQMQDRLGSAGRLATGKFVGAPAVVNLSDAIEAVQCLGGAFVDYHKHLDGSVSERDQAAIALEVVLGRVKHDAHRWE